MRINASKLWVPLVFISQLSLITTAFALPALPILSLPGLSPTSSPAAGTTTTVAPTTTTTALVTTTLVPTTIPITTSSIVATTIPTTIATTTAAAINTTTTTTTIASSIIPVTSSSIISTTTSSSSSLASTSTSPTTSASPSPTPPAANTNTKSNTPVIVGGVVGGVVGLAFISGLLSWINRRGGCTKRTERNGDGNSFDNDPHDMPAIEKPVRSATIPRLNNQGNFDQSHQYNQENYANAQYSPGYSDQGTYHNADYSYGQPRDSYYNPYYSQEHPPVDASHYYVDPYMQQVPHGVQDQQAYQQIPSPSFQHQDIQSKPNEI